MLAQEYYDFKKGLTAKGIILSYTGYVSEKILFALGEAIRQKMALDDVGRSVTNKVFSVFVEQVQNIIRYSEDKIPDVEGTEVTMRSGVITVGREDERFFVVCGNTVNSDSMNKLKLRLDYLAGLDKAQLKAYYKEKLRGRPGRKQSGGRRRID